MMIKELTSWGAALLSALVVACFLKAYLFA